MVYDRPPDEYTAVSRGYANSRKYYGYFPDYDCDDREEVTPDKALVIVNILIKEKQDDLLDYHKMKLRLERRLKKRLENRLHSQ